MKNVPCIIPRSVAWPEYIARRILAELSNTNPKSKLSLMFALPKQSDYSGRLFFYISFDNYLTTLKTLIIFFMMAKKGLNMAKLTDAEFWQYFHRVSVCGKFIIEIEGKALDSSLFSIFNRRNHAEFIQSLNGAIHELEVISRDADAKFDDSEKLIGLINLIHQMTKFASALRTVCSGLHEKTQGRPYAHAQYTSDLNMLDAFKSNCITAQSNLLR